MSLKTFAMTLVLLFAASIVWGQQASTQPKAGTTDVADVVDVEVHYITEYTDCNGNVFPEITGIEHRLAPKGTKSPKRVVREERQDCKVTSSSPAPAATYAPQAAAYYPAAAPVVVVRPRPSTIQTLIRAGRDVGVAYATRGRHGFFGGYGGYSNPYYNGYGTRASRAAVVRAQNDACAAWGFVRTPSPSCR